MYGVGVVEIEKNDQDPSWILGPNIMGRTCANFLPSWRKFELLQRLIFLLGQKLQKRPWGTQVVFTTFRQSVGFSCIV